MAEKQIFYCSLAHKKLTVGAHLAHNWLTLGAQLEHNWLTVGSHFVYQCTSVPVVNLSVGSPLD